ncbi:uncharacterized protein HD556DRAFT_1450170 [Suillus plorans]|uniref:Uncharacterized protein n=1 Tax=Suillus plorans TaxID=116603 RepID=A0A9P7AD82_9AGAM|nr:uncharacterized protein HD556DRAFT_1450170 [Suillus plorans]KAG1785968.1 hypothetical protein HD556DRAFT_1450170 [Suillus plorans]
MASLSPSQSESDNYDIHPLVALKRRIAALEEENADLRVHRLTVKKCESNVYYGRSIRRLVCLTERVEDLVAEFDRRIGLGAANESDADIMDSDNPEENRRYRSFKKLMIWCPSVCKLLRSSAEHETLAFAYNKLNESSDGARGDDSAGLKRAVADWLMECTPTPNPPIHKQSKSGQGFYHDMTGRLLCPVDYNWSDPIVRASIRDYHPDFRITACSWPSFLYKDGHYDPQNPAKDLFKGELLVKAFKRVFTSPSSTDEEQAVDSVARSALGRNSGERRTRRDVSTLLNMRSIQPRAIAYISVQLRFALSSSGSWRVVDDEFNNQEFYDNIVDYLELPPTPEAAKEVDDILLWWNRKVFGRKHVSDYRPQQANHMSVAMTLAKRCCP